MKKNGDRKQPNWEWGEESKRKRWDFFDFFWRGADNLQKDKDRKKEIITLTFLWILYTLFTFIAFPFTYSANLLVAGFALTSTVCLLGFIHWFCWSFQVTSIEFIKFRFTKQLLIISIISIVLVSCAMLNMYLNNNIKLIDLLASFF